MFRSKAFAVSRRRRANLWLLAFCAAIAAIVCIWKSNIVVVGVAWGVQFLGLGGFVTYRFVRMIRRTKSICLKTYEPPGATMVALCVSALFAAEATGSLIVMGIVLVLLIVFELFAHILHGRATECCCQICSEGASEVSVSPSTPSQAE
jgi:hypothetical protein